MSVYLCLWIVFAHAADSSQWWLGPGTPYSEWPALVASTHSSGQLSWRALYILLPEF